MVEIETIEERFGLAVTEHVEKLQEVAKESAEEDESLLTAVCVVEEHEFAAAELWHRLEQSREAVSGG
jgi:(p)ppGpp synthase/HD superfamily hydrolase